MGAMESCSWGLILLDWDRERSSKYKLYFLTHAPKPNSHPSAHPQRLCELLSTLAQGCSKPDAQTHWSPVGLVPVGKEKRQAIHITETETTLQEALVLLMVVMLGSSMEVFLEKVASNLALCSLGFHQAGIWRGEGEAYGGI